MNSLAQSLNPHICTGSRLHSDVRDPWWSARCNERIRKLSTSGAELTPLLYQHRDHHLSGSANTGRGISRAVIREFKFVGGYAYFWVVTSFAAERTDTHPQSLNAISSSKSRWLIPKM